MSFFCWNRYCWLVHFDSRLIQISICFVEILSSFWQPFHCRVKSITFLFQHFWTFFYSFCFLHFLLWRFRDLSFIISRYVIAHLRNIIVSQLMLLNVNEIGVFSYKYQFWLSLFKFRIVGLRLNGRTIQIISQKFFFTQSTIFLMLAWWPDQHKNFSSRLVVWFQTYEFFKILPTFDELCCFRVFVLSWRKIQKIPVLF